MRIHFVSRIFLMLLLLGAVSACAPPQIAPQAERTIPSQAAPAASSTGLPIPKSIETMATVRPAAFAGTWYPGDPDDIRSTVDNFLAATKLIDGAPVALIVPHAGYAYSGQVAAAGFKQLAQGTYDVAVIIGADHAEPISDPIAVYPDGGFETPLGVVPVDTDLAQALIAADSRIKADPAAHAGEHVVEIELPFLQRVCPGCRIVPVLIGTDDPATVAALGDTLAKVLPGRRAVMIASSDLSHYPAYADAVTVDRDTLNAIETGDPAAVRSTIASSMARGTGGLATCACGESAVLAVMQAAKQLGADTVSVLRYANSGDVAGADRNQVVGYGAVMFWRSELPQLSAEQRTALLAAARAAIAEHLKTDQIPEASVSDPILNRPAGAFVTLTEKGELRGCIGHMTADAPLVRTIQEMAVAAAESDPRFPSLTPEELDKVKLEISILSPVHSVTDLNAIRVGADGLMIVKYGARGVFLPQVPVQEGWDRDAYLENLCLKAGLERGCWKENASLYSFTAIVFGENEP
jgi:AmmeMemoRadiSam system protein B/AmmeMemoRadiSam system protein A